MNDGNQVNNEHQSCKTAQECRAIVRYAGEQTNKLRKYRDATRMVRQNSHVMGGGFVKIPQEVFNRLVSILRIEEMELFEDTADA